MNGRYLLDGGLPGASLKAYLRGLVQYPPIILPELHRMIFAAASLVINVDRLRDWYLQKRRAKMKA